MKKDYSGRILLRCVVCGSDSDFDSNEDKTYIKCKKCNREYLGGYDELVELNQVHIQDEINKMKDEVIHNAEENLRDSLEKALKGNKFVKFK